MSTNTSTIDPATRRVPQLGGLPLDRLSPGSHPARIGPARKIALGDRGGRVHEARTSRLLIAARLIVARRLRLGCLLAAAGLLSGAVR